MRSLPRDLSVTLTDLTVHLARSHGSVHSLLPSQLTLITRTAPCLRQLPSCVAVYPRDFPIARVLCLPRRSLGEGGSPFPKALHSTSRLPIYVAVVENSLRPQEPERRIILLPKYRMICHNLPL